MLNPALKSEIGSRAQIPRPPLTRCWEMTSVYFTNEKELKTSFYLAELL